MRTHPTLHHMGGSLSRGGLPGQRSSRQRHLWKEHGTRQPDRKWHHTENPLHLWTERLTYACENITLPQTSLAGGNNEDWALMNLGVDFTVWLSSIFIANTSPLGYIPDVALHQRCLPSFVYQCTTFNFTVCFLPTNVGFVLA